MADTANQVKCVVVGDNGTGKTTLLIRYTTGRFCPPKDVPLVFDNCIINVAYVPMTHVFTESQQNTNSAYKDRVNDKFYAIGLWDTHKPEEHDRLRQLAYPGTDVLLVCFSVVNRGSFDSIEYLWLSEIHHFCPGVPWVLVGTQVDRRVGNDPNIYSKRNKTVTTREAQKIAQKFGAFTYVECSALEQINVEDVFVQAVIASQPARQSRERKKTCVPF